MNWYNPRDNKHLRMVLRYMMKNHRFRYHDAKTLYLYAFEFMVMMEDFGHLYPERVLAMLGLPKNYWEDFLKASPNCSLWHSPTLEDTLAQLDEKLACPFMAKVDAKRRNQQDSQKLKKILQLLMDYDGYSYQQGMLLYYYAYNYENVLEDMGYFYPSFAMGMLALHRNGNLTDDDFLNAGYPESDETDNSQSKEQ
jgi:hypothetical protein